eukprot:1425122-Amphidinium_carterae.2
MKDFTSPRRSPIQLSCARANLHNYAKHFKAKYCWMTIESVKTYLQRRSQYAFVCCQNFTLPHDTSTPNFGSICDQVVVILLVMPRNV